MKFIKKLRDCQLMIEIMVQYYVLELLYFRIWQGTSFFIKDEGSGLILSLSTFKFYPNIPTIKYLLGKEKTRLLFSHGESDIALQTLKS